jgi:hypothetical protein
MLCTCGHPVKAHTEYGSTARINGPVTNRACKLCLCWKPKTVDTRTLPHKWIPERCLDCDAWNEYNGHPDHDRCSICGKDEFTKEVRSHIDG